MIPHFSLAPTPNVHFGAGKISSIIPLVKGYGSKVLLVTGARSFTSSEEGQLLRQQFDDAGILAEHCPVALEPAPALINDATRKFAQLKPDCVVAIGGGSALDAGKAISAMLPIGGDVKDYLEGVGNLVHPGVKIPFVAVPTTSGTGSEATKNAVISETGENGFKRSLRHNNFVPNQAIIDPALAVNCPPATTAASGMDAFTQLLESFLSTASNPLTDSLALEGLHRVSRSLLNAYRDGHNLEARADMALAAYISGITLANAGLGLVHGFAGSIGGYFDIPHGVICSALMGPANILTVRQLKARKTNDNALLKYSAVGRIFSKGNGKSDDYYIDSLLDVIAKFRSEMKIPTLSSFGLNPVHFNKILDSTDNKNNPIKLEREEMLEVLNLPIGVFTPGLGRSG